MTVFYSKWPVFAKLKKQPCASLTFETEKLYTKFYQNPLTGFAINRVTDRRMDGRTGVIS